MEQSRSGVSDISERGLVQEREMVNPEWSWSGVIIKCSERGGEIVATPLLSHTVHIHSATALLKSMMRNDWLMAQLNARDAVFSKMFDFYF